MELPRCQNSSSHRLGRACPFVPPTQCPPSSQTQKKRHLTLFAPAPDVADHGDAEELPVLVSIQLFWPTISGRSTILVSLLFISSRLLAGLGQSHTHCPEFLRKSSNVICAPVGKVQLAYDGGPVASRGVKNGKLQNSNSDIWSLATRILAACQALTAVQSHSLIQLSRLYPD